MKKLKILPILSIVSLPIISLPLVSCSNYDPIDGSTDLYFQDVKNDSKEATILYTIDGSALDIDIEYKLGDHGNWTDWAKDSPITLKNGQKMYIRNTKNTLSNRASHFKFLTTGGDVVANGNINSMINYASLSAGCFLSLFFDCKTLKRGPVLPATELAESCYQNMFSYCSGLTQAPELPAENLADYCYTGMFSGCTSLKVAPELHSKNLAPHCYDQMFDICGLTQAPELPAENLAEGCYAFMFSHCAMKEAPALPSTHLADKCYYYMFSNCKELVKTMEVLPATNLKLNCYDHMFAYCDNLKTATKISGQIIDKNVCGSCFEKMFKNCPQLNIKQDYQGDNFIYDFNDDIVMLDFAKEMFAIDNSSRYWQEDGTPIAGHSYYWVN